MNINNYLTISDIAELINRNKSVAWTYVKKGLLPEQNLKASELKIKKGMAGRTCLWLKSAIIERLPEVAEYQAKQEVKREKTRKVKKAKQQRFCKPPETESQRIVNLAFNQLIK